MNTVIAISDATRQFPCMLYHTANEPIIVKNRMELEEAFMRGFSMSPEGITQEEILVVKLEALMEQIGEIKRNLRIVRGQDPDGEDEEEYEYVVVNEEDLPPNLLKGFEGGIAVTEPITEPEPEPTSASQRKRRSK
jgi:hypothetical protein